MISSLSPLWWLAAQVWEAQSYHLISQAYLAVLWLGQPMPTCVSKPSCSHLGTSKPKETPTFFGRVFKVTVEWSSFEIGLNKVNEIHLLIQQKMFGSLLLARDVFSTRETVVSWNRHPLPSWSFQCAPSHKRKSVQLQTGVGCLRDGQTWTLCAQLCRERQRSSLHWTQSQLRAPFNDGYASLLSTWSSSLTFLTADQGYLNSWP